jgi:hypothetical protein
VSAPVEPRDSGEPECSWCGTDERDAAYCSKRCEDEARESNSDHAEPEVYTAAERLADIAWEEGL